MEYQQRDQQGAGTGRLLLFGFFCFVILFGWQIIQTTIWPPAPRDEIAEVDDEGNGEEAAAEKPVDGGEARPAEGGNEKPGEDPVKPKAPEFKLPGHPALTVKLGSDDAESGFTMSVEIESLGAGVRSATLNGKQFVVADLPKDFPKDKPRPQLSILGNNVLGEDPFSKVAPEKRPELSFDLAVASVDRAWRKVDPKASMTTLNWRLARKETHPGTNIVSSATFELKSPDGLLTFRKTFSLNREPENSKEESGELTEEEKADAASERVAANMLDVTLTITNSSNQDRKLQYVLQGPVGLPLEKRARKQRDIQAGFLNGDDDISTETLSAATLVGKVNDDDVDLWTKPLKYIGVDTQYFAALMFPGGNQLKKPYFEEVEAVLIGSAQKEKAWHDLSVEMTSRELTVQADGSVRDSFQVYLGPKRIDTLEGLKADGIIDNSWLSFTPIRNLMVFALDKFHGWGLPFGLSIILLTVCVRCCMFPISRKMARSQKRMKDLQPQIAELKEKFKDEPQKMSQAQMELWRKEGVNPLGGCLPALCQLPIFVGLYSALNTWVDLRMASFLWIDNLAAPDHFADLPFALPILGDWFNLLPLITIGLFYGQQKMTMPPPINDEMAMQQKMMTFMMIFMGFLFYKFPAGLNVYFISSSIWGMCERKIIEKIPEKPVDPAKEEARRKKKENGWFAKMMKNAMEAAELQQQLDSQRDGTADKQLPGSRPHGNRGGGKGNRKKKNRRR